MTPCPDYLEYFKTVKALHVHADPSRTIKMTATGVEGYAKDFPVFLTVANRNHKSALCDWGFRHLIWLIYHSHLQAFFLLCPLFE